MVPIFIEKKYREPYNSIMENYKMKFYRNVFMCIYIYTYQFYASAIFVVWVSVID